MINFTTYKNPDVITGDDQWQRCLFWSIPEFQTVGLQLKCLAFSKNNIDNAYFSFQSLFTRQDSNLFSILPINLMFLSDPIKSSGAINWNIKLEIEDSSIVCYVMGSSETEVRWFFEGEVQAVQNKD